MPKNKKTINNYHLIVYIKRRSCIVVELVGKLHKKWGNNTHSIFWFASYLSLRFFRSILLFFSTDRSYVNVLQIHKKKNRKSFVTSYLRFSIVIPKRTKCNPFLYI